MFRIYRVLFCALLTTVALAQGDNLPPSSPTGVTATSITSTGFTLNWTASTDNVGVVAYLVSGNFPTIDGITTTSTTVTGLPAGMTCWISVQARDAAGNLSPPSMPLTVTTAPNAPIAMVGSIGYTSFMANWFSNGPGVASYRLDVSADSAFSTFIINNQDVGAATNYTVTGLAPGTTYYFRVRALNSAGAASDNSFPFQVNTQRDNQPPTPPAGLSATNIASTGFTLNWAASTDNVGVVAYRVMGSGPPIDGITTTSAAITGLTPGMTYWFSVQARDASNNWSPPANLSVTTAPSAPNAMANQTGYTTFVANWFPSGPGAASFRLDVATDSAFANLLLNNQDMGAATSYTVTGLTPGTTYYFRVRALNSAGAASDNSFPAQVNTQPDYQPPTAPTGLSATSITTTGLTLNWTAATDNVGVVAYRVVGSGPPIDGITTTSAAIAGLTPGTTYWFSVQARDGANNWSPPANLSVTTASLAIPPTIATQPAAATVTEGFGATFSVVASGTAPLTYQWFKGGASIAGATGASYTIAATDEGDAGGYAVVVTNGAGAATSGTALLTVNSEIVGQPQNANVPAGGTGTFSVVARDPALAVYQWQRMAVGTASFVSLANGGSYAGVTGATLTVSGVTAAMTGDQFRCLVSLSGSANYAGTSAAATLTDPPVTTLTVDLAARVLAFDPTVPGSYPSGGAAVAGASYTVGNVLQLRSVAQFPAGQTGSVTKHVVCIRRPQIAAEGIYPSAPQAWNYNPQTEQDEWPGPSWNGVPTTADLGIVPFVNLSLNASSHQIGQEIAYSSAESDPTDPHADLVLDAPGDWEVQAFAVDDTGQKVWWNNGQSTVIHVVSPVLKTTVSEFPLGLPQSAGGNYPRYAGAFWNAGQNNTGALDTSPDAGTDHFWAGYWHGVWKPYPSVGAEVPWRGLWAGHDVYAIVPTTSAGSQLSHYTQSAVATQTGNDAKVTEFAKRAAVRMMDVGIDFVIFDHTNIITRNVATAETTDDVIQSAGNTQLGFAQAAAEAGNKPAIKITFMIGFVPGSQNWHGDQSGATFDTDKDKVNAKLKTLYDNFARDPSIWFYYPDQNGVSKPLLLLYTGAPDANKPHSRCQMPDAWSADEGCKPGELDGTHLGALHVGTAADSKPLTDVFTIRYIGAYLKGDANLTNGDVINNGHWSYVEGSHNVPYTPAPAGANYTGSECMTIVPEFRNTTASSARTDRFGRTWNGSVLATAGETVHLSRNGKMFNAALDEAVNPHNEVDTDDPNRPVIVARNPKILLTIWQEFGNPASDEMSPERSWTVIDNNKYGTFYGDIFKRKVHELKGLTDQAALSVPAQSLTAYAGVPWSPAINGGTGGGNGQFVVLGRTNWDASSAAGTQLSSANTVSVTWTPSAADIGSPLQFYVRKLGDATHNDSPPSGPFSLTVLASAAPSITAQPAGQTATAGATVTFTAGAGGAPAPTLQWQKNGAPLAGAINATLTLNNVQLSDAGNYALVATNPLGAATSNVVTLTVNVMPVITLQPTSQSVTTGATVTFASGASGTPTPTLQWQKNGAAIPGATGASLTLNSVQSADAATYRLVATNAAGTATSNSATLTVNPANVAPSIGTQPSSQTVTAGNTVSLTVGASGTPTPTYQWWKDGSPVAGATSATYTITNVQAGQAGNYSVVVTNIVSSVTSGTAILTVTPANSAPVITAQPTGQTVTVGANVVFTSGATGTPTPTLQWQKNGAAIPGATGASLTLTSVQSADAATYTLVATNVAGTATSNGATLTVNPVAASWLTNISARGKLNGSFIVGVTVGSSGSKQVLLRAVGPGLNQFGISDTLDDPQMTLYNSSNVQVGSNDDWGSAYSSGQVTQAGAFGLPTASKDAALLATLSSSGYSAVVDGKGGAGIVLVEAYDLDGQQSMPPARFTNLSVRNYVGTGSEILIVGFNITGNTTKNLLIRGVGPGLVQFGVTGTLVDPQLTLYNSSNLQVGWNDDWGSTYSSSQVTQAGAFALPAASKDAVIIAGLQPGSYTVQVVGANSTTGVALLEIYELP